MSQNIEHGPTGLLISFVLMIYGAVSQNAQSWHFPPWIMEGSQILAWWCVGGTFVITLLNYFGIKINPFKKKGKKQ